MNLIIIFFCLSFCYSQSAKTFLLKEDFLDNRNDWIMEDYPIEQSIDSGFFYVNNDAASSFKTLKIFEIDTNRNFRIELSLQWIESETPSHFGLFFGSKDQYEFQFFGIGSAGYALAYQFKESSRSSIQLLDKTFDPIIRKGQNHNLIVLEKRDKFYHFFVNGKELGRYRFISFLGKQFGMGFFNKQEIKFHKLHIYYFN